MMGHPLPHPFVEKGKGKTRQRLDSNGVESADAARLYTSFLTTHPTTTISVIYSSGSEYWISLVHHCTVFIYLLTLIHTHTMNLCSKCNLLLVSACFFLSIQLTKQRPLSIHHLVTLVLIFHTSDRLVNYCFIVFFFFA